MGCSPRTKKVEAIGSSFVRRGVKRVISASRLPSLPPSMKDEAISGPVSDKEKVTSFIEGLSETELDVARATRRERGKER